MIIIIIIIRGTMEIEIPSGKKWGNNVSVTDCPLVYSNQQWRPFPSSVQ